MKIIQVNSHFLLVDKIVIKAPGPMLHWVGRCKYDLWRIIKKRNFAYKVCSYRDVLSCK